MANKTINDLLPKNTAPDLVTGANTKIYQVTEAGVLNEIGMISQIDFDNRFVLDPIRVVGTAQALEFTVLREEVSGNITVYLNKLEDYSLEMPKDVGQFVTQKKTEIHFYDNRTNAIIARIKGLKFENINPTFNTDQTITFTSTFQAQTAEFSNDYMKNRGY